MLEKVILPAVPPLVVVAMDSKEVVTKLPVIAEEPIPMIGIYDMSPLEYQRSVPALINVIAE